jgi:hypothetical protein
VIAQCKRELNKNESMVFGVDFEEVEQMKYDTALATVNIGNGGAMFDLFHDIFAAGHVDKEVKSYIVQWQPVFMFTNDGKYYFARLSRIENGGNGSN